MTTDKEVASTIEYLATEKLAQDILSTIEREREREIVSRRFGLFDRRETLEQIGELLGITRERVRQLEKSVVARLKQSGAELPNIVTIQAKLIDVLSATGKLARVSALSQQLTANNSKTDQSRIAFLAELCPELVIIDENDFYYQAVGIEKIRPTKAIKTAIDKLIDAIKKQGKPASIETIATSANFKDPAEAKALVSISKKLATLNGQWGLIKWPTVNPKNIRDKIYVILKESGKHMHFNDISKAIKDSAFKRKDVTTQAIHNELIKDKRFVLIGRGIYALKEWGYKRGTVSDIIAEVLKSAAEPLHRDEIVKRVLKSRFVKETTILLNLQGKPQFKRVAKATYTLNEEPVAPNVAN